MLKLICRSLSRRLLTAVALWTFTFWLAEPGHAQGQAQVPTPTPEQLQLLNSLPPAQREQILRQLRQMQAQQRQTEPAESPEIMEAPGARDGTALDEDGEAADVGRLAVGSTIVIEFTMSETATEGIGDDQRASLDAFRDRLASGNPYVLDASGNLYLPGVPTIALAGLNVDEAAIRLKAETSLRNLQIFVTLLPLEPVGIDALEPFGYDLFVDGLPATFAPATDVPVPSEYVMGPGDTVNVQLYGNQNAEYALVVSREGTVNFPAIGPISVGGLTFAELREVVTQRITEQMIGVRVSITLGELRSIRVFVLGDVERPGSYAVSGLSTATNALFVSGGVQEIGSLRRIEIKRDGETVSTLDLYDLLLRGDTSGDVRLQPGDVIFVPPIGDTVTLAGGVRRPAIYELDGETTVAQVLDLAGGLRADSDSTTLKLQRIVPGRGISVRDINLGITASSSVQLEDGDVIQVPTNLELLEGAVRLSGNVQQPGLYEWFDGMRLTDLVNSSDRVKPMSDLQYVLVRREIEPNVYIEVVSADLQAAWRLPGGPANIELQPRDTVFVFNLEVGRRYVVDPLLEELRAQAPANQPVASVNIGGQVRAPGEYPLEPGMRLSDLVRAGGGLTEAAYTRDAELTRYEIVGGDYRETGIVTVNLSGILNGDATANGLVRAHDYLNIKEVPQWGGQETVEIVGEVQFPGVYPIRQGELLSSVLDRAGGPTAYAFLQGSVFTRVDLRQRERDQLETLARRLENDLATLSLSDPDASDALTTGQTLVSQLREAVPTGRLVIRLEDVIAGLSNADVALKGGDRLVLPELSQEITVLGEVQYPTSHLYEAGLVRGDYVERSGGLTARADQRRIYVVRANGEVVIDGRSRWFRRQASSNIRAGDTVVVPLDVDRGRGLARWSNITQIIYNTAIAAAAVQSF